MNDRRGPTDEDPTDDRSDREERGNRGRLDEDEAFALAAAVEAVNAQFLRRVDLEFPSLPGVSPSESARPAD